MGKEYRKASVNEDVELLLEDLRLGKEVEQMTSTYFLPKLRDEEIELAEKRDICYARTFLREFRIHFSNSLFPKEDAMGYSLSDTQFVEGWGHRTTLKIENSFQENSSQENSSQENKTHCCPLQ